MGIKNKVGKKSVFESTQTAYLEALKEFLKNEKRSFNSECYGVEKEFMADLTKEQLLAFNEDDFKKKVMNEMPAHQSFINAVVKTKPANYINKSLIVYNTKNNIREADIIEKLILSSNFRDKEVFINNFQNKVNVLNKDKLIEGFKENYKEYTKNQKHTCRKDYFSPIFSSGTTPNQNFSIPFLKLKDLNVVPVIQFPKLFEYINLNQNRELIQFLLKYLLIHDKVQNDEEKLLLKKDSHFFTICLLLHTENSKIDYNLLKQFYDEINELGKTKDTNIKFASSLDPVGKFPQILKMNEYDLKNLFSKLDIQFKKDYETAEALVESINDVLLKPFLEHFLKISLLIKFIVSQIINVTLQLECSHYSNEADSSVAELPSIDEFATVKILLPKILGIQDTYTFSNGKELHFSYNLNSREKATLQDIKTFSAPTVLLNEEDAAVKSKCFGSSKKTSKQSTIVSTSDENEEFLDYSLMLNWIVPLLNRFFVLPVCLPKFYTINSLTFAQFNGFFKDEVYFTLISEDNFKKLHLDVPEFMERLKIETCYTVAMDIDFLAEKDVSSYAFIKDQSSQNAISMNAHDLERWNEHMLNEYRTAKQNEDVINKEIEKKMERLDNIRFNRIPNLINGKFDDMLSSEVDKAAISLALGPEITSTDNKDLNTNSKYYKFFQESSSITDDLNVNTLKLKLQKARDQVLSLEKRSAELKEDQSKADINENTSSNDVLEEIQTLKDENKVFDATLIDLQEEYKTTSTVAFEKVTQLNYLKEQLAKKEKYLKILESASKNKEEELKTLEEAKIPVQAQNYQSLLKVLNSRHQKMTEGEK